MPCPGASRVQDAGPGPAPSLPPRWPGVLPASTPGLEGPPRPQALGRGGPGRREVPGGCPATPPLARACPRRAWCRAESGGPDGSTEGGWRGSRGCSRLRRRAYALCPGWPRAPTPGQGPSPSARRPSSQPSPQLSRINRKCGERPTRPPEVWRPRFRQRPSLAGNRIPRRAAESQ